MMTSFLISLYLFFPASSNEQLRLGVRTTRQAPMLRHISNHFIGLFFRHGFLSVPAARLLALRNPPAYAYRYATKQPLHIISVGYLGPSTTGFCSRSDDKPTPSLEGNVQRKGPGVTASDDYLEPPTPTIPAPAPTSTP